MQIQIVKFELYPSDEPTGYAVGFNIITGNNRQFYRDTIVPLEQAVDKSDKEIVELGWNILKTPIEAEVIRLETKVNLIGSTWIPPLEVDNTILVNLITQCLELYNTAVEGIEEGQYTEGSKDLFLLAINKAEETRENTQSLQQEIDVAITILQEDLSTFESAKI